MPENSGQLPENITIEFTTPSGREILLRDLGDEFPKIAELTSKADGPFRISVGRKRARPEISTPPHERSPPFPTLRRRIFS